MNPAQPTLTDLLAKLAEEIDLAAHGTVVHPWHADFWQDRFSDGYCWSMLGEWSIGTTGHTMSDLRADCMGFEGPVTTKLEAAVMALRIVRARKAAGEAVW